MKRLLYGLCLFAAATLGATAQERVRLGTIPSTDNVVKIHTAPAMAQQARNQNFSIGIEPQIPAFMLAEEFRYRFETRKHPFPTDQNAVDTAVRVYSKTDPSTYYPIGFTYIPQRFSDASKYGNGFVQFIPPMKTFQPELTGGTFTLDTLFFAIFPSGGPDKPVTRGVDIYIYQLPKDSNAGKTTFTGFSHDITEANPNVVILGGGPVATLSADDINGKVTPGSQPGTYQFQYTTIDLRDNNKQVEIDTKKSWAIAFLKQNRADTNDKLAMIGAYEWGTPTRQTYAGMDYYDPEWESDTIETLWSSISFTVDQASYPTLRNTLQTQGVKKNHTIYISGMYNGEVSSVEPVAKSEDFMLEQNMPNPVEGTTNIRFSVKETNLVTLRVVNSLGQTVAELQNGVLQGGYSYDAKFDASNLPQGTYFYTLTSGAHSTMRTMQVVR